MTREEAQIIIGNIPINPEALDDCYDITKYQEAKTMAIKSLEAWEKVIEEIESQQNFNIECDGESDLGIAIQIIKKHFGEVEE